MSLRLTFLCVCILAVPSAIAQDPFGADPFGGAAGDDPFGNGPSSDGLGNNMGSDATGFGDFGQSPSPTMPATASATDSAGEAEDADPVVRMLRAAPPQTPDKMAKGLTWMVRIRRWDEVGRLLDQVAAKDWDLAQKAVLARAAGSAILLRLRSDEAELTDGQRTLVKEILTAPAQLSRNPKQIDLWIDKLGSDKPGERRLSQLRLHDASMAGIQRLVSRLLDGDTKVAPEVLANTVIGFGDDGIRALQTACLVGEPSRAARVFQTLPHIPGRHFTAELGAGLASRLLPLDAQSDLAAALSMKYGSLPSMIAVHDYLENDFQDGLAEYQVARTRNTQFSDLTWRLTSDRRSIQQVQVSSDQFALERLAQIATLRMQLKTVTNVDTIECGAALLQHAYQASPQMDLNELAPTWLTGLSDQPSRGVYWQRVFAKAGDWQMHGAALRALQMLAENKSSDRRVIDFLSGLLKDSRPMIRYSAMKALADLDPQTSYSGAEKAIEIALEMTRLGGGPHSLVIGLQAELRQAAQQQLQLQTGAGVTAVNSARSALLALDGDDPIELIVIVDRVADQSVYELLQRLRNTKKGHSLPIAVLTDQLYQHERTLIGETPGVFASVLSRNAQQMQRVVRRMLDSLDTEPMTAANRVEFGMAAESFLATIASDRNRYRFYPIGDWREHLVTTASGMSSDQGAQLLSGLGTSESQQKLVQMAANRGMSEVERSNAARMFASSVRRFGMRLERTEVQSSYDLYNQLGPTDPTAARSLGTILDVIEAQAGEATWPSGL